MPSASNDPACGAVEAVVGRRWRGGVSLALRLVLALLMVAVWFAKDTRTVTEGGRFAWTSPQLDDPTTVSLDAGPTYTLLDRGNDYIIDLPDEVKVGHTMIEGGRNIVIRGGHVTVPSDGRTDAERRGIYIKNATGTVHIEGIAIDGLESRGFDGISISAPEAIVQIVNVRVTGITGRFDGFHGDVVQPFGGVRELRIDHLSGTSNYQGLYLTETSGAIGSADIRNVNLSYEANRYDETTYLLWLPVNPSSCETYPVVLKNVYMSPRPGQQVAGFAVWPNTDQPAGCTAVETARGVAWPSLPEIDGSVAAGAPPGGDFVVEGSVGLRYDLPRHTPIRIADSPYLPTESLMPAQRRILLGTIVTPARSARYFFRRVA